MSLKMKKNFDFLSLLTLFQIILFLSSISIYADNFSKDNIVTINKIKIIIDGQLYEWEEPAKIPQKNEINNTHPITIISFLDIKPLDKIKIRVLEQKLFNIEKNLKDSGYFFASSAYFVQSSKGNNFVNVIIEVTEGFTDRFGGGSIFGIFGKDNLFGLRKGYMVALGYNLDGIKYYDHLISNSNFFLNTSLFYQNGFGFSDISFHKIDFEFEIGYRVKPTLSFSLISSLGYEKSNVLESFSSYFIYVTFFKLSEGIKFQYNYYYLLNIDNKNKNNNNNNNNDNNNNNINNNDNNYSKSGFFIRGVFILYPSFQYYFNYSNYFNYFNKFFPIINLKKIFMLETKYLSVGFHSHFYYSSNITDYFSSYNLSYSENPFIRAPIAKSQAFPDTLLATNFEIRSPEFTIFLGSIFNFVFSIFLFDDIALCKFLYKTEDNLPSSLQENRVPYTENTIFGKYFYILNGIGIGIRFGLASPINVYFTLTYGINLNGKGSFTLVYGKGF